MSITDELRAYTGGFYLFRYKDVREKLDAIADRIDAEHEAKVSYWQGASYKDGYDEGFASADDWFAQREDTMAEHGWIRLPKDANGEYIRVGDELAGYGYPNGGAYCKAIVGEWGILAAEQDCKYQRWLLWSADAVRHYHAPTVEDVLREFADRVCNSGHQWGLDAADTIAEYAKRLSLAEVEDA